MMPSKSWLAASSPGCQPGNRGFGSHRGRWGRVRGARYETAPLALSGGMAGACVSETHAPRGFECSNLCSATLFRRGLLSGRLVQWEDSGLASRQSGFESPDVHHRLSRVIPRRLDVSSSFSSPGCGGCARDPAKVEDQVRFLAGTSNLGGRAIGYWESVSSIDLPTIS